MTAAKLPLKKPHDKVPTGAQHDPAAGVGISIHDQDSQMSLSQKSFPQAVEKSSQDNHVAEPIPAAASPEVPIRSAPVKQQPQKKLAQKPVARRTATARNRPKRAAATAAELLNKQNDEDVEETASGTEMSFVAVQPIERNTVIQKRARATTTTARKPKAPVASRNTKTSKLPPNISVRINVYQSSYAVRETVTVTLKRKKVLFLLYDSILV